MHLSSHTEPGKQPRASQPVRGTLGVGSFGFIQGEPRLVDISRDRISRISATSSAALQEHYAIILSILVKSV